MLKFQSPMLNNGVCRAMTDKQTHEQKNTHTNKHTYRVKTEETFLFSSSFFMFYFRLKKAFSKNQICKNLTKPRD